MIPEQEFDKDAAMLAGMVGGHLNLIDKMSMEQKNMPSNRIDMHSFIDSIKKGVPVLPNKYDPANKGYVSEELVRSQVPDVPQPLINKVEVNLVPEPALTVTPPQATPRPINKPTNISEEEITEFKKEIKEELQSIKSTLQHIDGTFTKISGMLGKVFNYLLEKEKK